MDPEVPLDHGELQHGQEVDRGLFVASGDPTGVLEPANAAFNHIASAVGLSLEFGRPPTSGIVDHAAVIADEVVFSAQMEQQRPPRSAQL